MRQTSLAAQVLEAGIGLDEVALGTHAVLDRLYFAVRDEHFGNIPLEVGEPVVTRDADGSGGMNARFEAVSRDPATAMTVTAEITVGADHLTARSHVLPSSEFLYNRMGWCLLHPASTSVGARLRATGGDADSELVLPDEIQPQRHVDGGPRSFLPAFDTISFTRDGVTARFELEGELFEIEDQRNWSDPSYKTYSSPLALGGRYRTTPGVAIEQTVRLIISGTAPSSGDRHDSLEVGAELGALPLVRLGRPAHPPALERPANGFVELNRERTPALDGIVLGINGSVHATDDRAVMSTGSTHGTMIRQARSIVGDGAPLVIDPLDFDATAREWAVDGRQVAAPPTPPADPRRRSEFGAAWVIASLATAATAGADELGYFDETVAGSPAASLLGELGALRGMPVREVVAPEGLAGLAVGDRVWVANLTATVRSVGEARVDPFSAVEI